MKKIFIYIPIVAAALTIMTACGGKTTESETTATLAQETKYPVRTEKLAATEIVRDLSYTANLVAFKEVHFAPATPGRINKIHVDINSRVKKGQVLVEMDQTQLNQAASQYANAEYNFLRIDTLHNLGSISEQQYEQAKTQYEVAKTTYENLKENTTLESPVDGIITGKYFEDGELYLGSPNAATGKAAVVSVMQINPLKANVSVSQQYYNIVKKGMNAELTLDIYGDEVFTGTVNKIYPTINPATRTFDVEILIQNENEKLRPGMFAKININLEEIEALVVPSIAVLKEAGTNTRYVFINKKGVAKRVNVTLGKRFDDRVEIIANGIKSGDELVVEGQARLLNGVELEVKNN